MHVLATAGHVDHGKSTLVRALTGMEPDRWAEERRRGMTIDLGYAWTTLPSGAVLAFVDVPGHQRFIGNMLAGLGPAPAVLFVVAADQGWGRQSGEHLAAVRALGLTRAVLAVTRSDLADPAPATAQALAELAAAGVRAPAAVAVSGRTGAGLADLTAALEALVAGLPAWPTQGRVRLWVDRAFTVRGAGTVVTGTLGAGTLRVGDELELAGASVRVRGLQSLGVDRQQVPAYARVAVNLRGVDREQVGRGDTLLTPGAWRGTEVLDVRTSVDAAALPAELMLHVGSAAVAVRIRPLGERAARLQLGRPLALAVGDRALLRDPGAQTVAAGVLVLDIDPPGLRRRGAAALRAGELGQRDAVLSVPVEVARRGAVRPQALLALGADAADLTGTLQQAGFVLDPATWRRWSVALGEVVAAHAAAAPLEPGPMMEAARRAVGLPDLALVAPLAAHAGLAVQGGRVVRPGRPLGLGAAEMAVATLEVRLAGQPFAAPEQGELDELGLGHRELAAAVAAGRLVRLDAAVVLLPDGPARAMRVLVALPQPFTLSAARQALGTTRRVAVPLLELLDARGWTRRVDGTLREVAR